MAGFAGRYAARKLNKPFILEVRDLWPQSIQAVGVAREGWLLRTIDDRALDLYRQADHIVVVTNSFKDVLASVGVPLERISVIPNGVDDKFLNCMKGEAEVAGMRSSMGLDGKFVVSYIGTVGLAHGLDTVLEAARRMRDNGVHFMIVGEGADRGRLEQEVRRSRLSNVTITGKIPRATVPLYYQLSDATLVLLRSNPVFERVLPSKMFEAMATGIPVILGVGGEALHTLLKAGAGIAVEPESADDVVAAIEKLHDDEGLCHELGAAGRSYVQCFHRREVLAHRYLRIISAVAEDSLPGDELDELGLPTYSGTEPAHAG
jgi:glycosyltransferase involved in cell wall biosynthesis